MFGMGVGRYSLEGNLTTMVTARANDDNPLQIQKLSMPALVWVGLLLVSIELIALGGNFLVCLAILTDNHLKRKASNRFLISLAVADILVAVFVMTFAIIRKVRARWDFGFTFCLIWISLDITSSTASILSLCAICVDRYLQITRALQYNMWITKRKIGVIIGILWLLSVFIGFIPIHAGMHKGTVVPPSRPGICYLGISFHFALVSSTISFYVPFIIVVTVYFKLFLIIRHHSKLLNPQVALQSPQDVRRPSRSSSMKATMTLGVIVGVFSICWLPFFIVNPIFAKCHRCISPLMFQVVTWLGWANSCANPFIYALMNKDFRGAFHRKLSLLKRIDVETTVSGVPPPRTTSIGHFHSSSGLMILPITVSSRINVWSQYPSRIPTPQSKEHFIAGDK